MIIYKFFVNLVIQKNLTKYNMKETYYFSHDYNARSDWKLIKVAMKHWMEWIWAFWCIIEMLYEEWWYLNIEEYDRITFELRVSYDIVESLINNFWLFEKDNTKFWSNSVLDRLKQRMEKSEKARESINKRWNKNKEENTTVLHSNYDSNTIKERKWKDNKEYKSCDWLSQEQIYSEMELFINSWNARLQEERKITDKLKEKYLSMRKHYSIEELRKSFAWYYETKKISREYRISPLAFITQQNWIPNYL